MTFVPLALLLALSAAAEPRLSVEARAFKPGEILLVVVEGADPTKPPVGSLRGETLEFFPAASTGTWLAFAGFDLEAATGAAVLQAAGAKMILTVEPAAFRVQELKVEQKFVTPAKNDSERAENESRHLRRLFSKPEPKRLFAGNFASPIPGAESARFGERRVFNGQPRAPHSGADLRAKTGKPVRAPAAGKVVLADKLFFQGNTVILDHGGGLTTLYAHLSKILVSPGRRVKKGAKIGLVGATGRVTGPHLHWALKLKNARVDPFSLTYLDLDTWLKPTPR